ncbi:MAG: tetraacyldisaccharide 4'-kinase [Cyanobacteria bacterium P01_H01_bin.74]
MSSISHCAVQFHYSRKTGGVLLARLISPLCVFYWVGLQLHRLQQCTFNKPLRSDDFEKKPFIISVGNITTGGTGKTPIVIDLASYFLKNNKTVLILSRGHAATQTSTDGQVNTAQEGDEAFLIQQKVPGAFVRVGKDRKSLLNTWVKELSPDVVILDDGFQYRRIQPDFSIVLLDGNRLLGNGYLLPVGPLREPIGALKRANCLIQTKAISPENQKKVLEIKKQSGHPALVSFTAPFQASQVLTAKDWMAVYTGQSSASNDIATSAQKEHVLLKGACLLVSGIADPQSFESAVLKLGGKIVKHCIFPDHATYPADSVNRIVQAFHQLNNNPTEQLTDSPTEPGNSCELKLITTEKDAVKLLPKLPQAVLAHAAVLCVAPQLPEELFKQLDLSLVKIKNGEETAVIRQ